MKLSFGYYAFALAVLIIAAVWFKGVADKQMEAEGYRTERQTR